MNACTHAARGLRGRNRTIALTTRFAVFALVIAVLAVMVNGASWVLVNTPPAANELVIARSFLHQVAGMVETADDASPADAHRDDPKHL